MIITVKPKSATPGGIKVIGKISQVGVYNEGVKGIKERVEQQSFTGGMFPGTRQPYIPKWSEKRGYVLKHKMNGKLVDLTDSELNVLVAQCYFYAKDNKMIETANRLNRQDPFFQILINKKPLIRNEGRFDLDDSKPLDQIWLGLVRGDTEDFGIAGEKSGLLSASQRYIIVDRSMDSVSETRIREKKQMVNKLWDSVSTDEEKLRKIARIGNLKKGKSLTDNIDDVKNAVYDMSQNTTDMISKEKNETVQDFFIQLARLDTENLNTRDIVALAKGFGYIKPQTQNGKKVFILLGNQVGSSMEAVQEYLTRSENSDVLSELSELIKSKI